uniref:G_PROTEIN_RECEP_F1_2 domain-containing protein n=1 Tax=Angiostrongylus cantonensis TaxID=6313 RepID=A0A158P7I2_ANGCA
MRARVTHTIISQWRMTSSSTTNDHHVQSFSIAIDNRMPSGLLEQDTALLETSQRTSTSIASSSGMKRKHHRLSDVVSTSDNTTDLRRNFGAYINERIPPGTFNIPFCPIQPMIPIWLMVTGVLIIVSSTMRIVRLIPSPQHRRSNLSLDLCCHISEGLLIVSNVVWLTLGFILSDVGDVSTFRSVTVHEYHNSLQVKPFAFTVNDEKMTRRSPPLE